MLMHQRLLKFLITRICSAKSGRETLSSAFPKEICEMIENKKRILLCFDWQIRFLTFRGDAL